MIPQTQTHPFLPVWNDQSRILILGSFPSVRSRETGFYYGHPQNRFWPLLARLFGEPIPQTNEERLRLAIRNGIALWDAVETCTITGSSDTSIRDVVPNDIAALISKTSIHTVLCNGQLAWRLYERHCAQKCGLHATPLPSTSAANAAWNMDRLMQAWQVILK